MSNWYYEELKYFQSRIERYVKEIFKVYGGELELRLEDYNLLERDGNCLESSTAFGYIIEEFLVSKLEIYSRNHRKHKKKDDDYVIRSADGSTTALSYDCYSYIGDEDIKALINIKAEKNNNNAIAAINKLYEDYVVRNTDEIKCFMIFKVNYSVGVSERDNERKIFIEGFTSYFLEEIDFSKGHKQDRRSWSEVYNPNSGRLQASGVFRKIYRLPEDSISYENTRETLRNIYLNNK